MYGQVVDSYIAFVILASQLDHQAELARSGNLFAMTLVGEHGASWRGGIK